MPEADAVFRLVDEIAGLRPFTVERVLRATGHDADRARVGEGRHFRSATARDGPGTRLFSEVQVRQRLLPAPGSDGLVILNLAPGPCIGEEAVTARYGADPAFSVQPPGAPESHYFTYPQAWGELRFGFSAEDCLVSAVLDATGH